MPKIALIETLRVATYKRRALVISFTIAAVAALASAPAFAQKMVLTPGARVLAVSRIQYDGNNFGNAKDYPFIFSDPNVFEVQGSIHLDAFLPKPGAQRLATIELPNSKTQAQGICTGFGSKSEGALALSVDGLHLTIAGYQAPVGAQSVTNSYTPGANLAGNTMPLYNRMIALINSDRSIVMTPEANAFSGDAPRAVVSVDGGQFYMAGNADSTTTNGVGPGTTIGVRYGEPGITSSYELGNYLATDRPDESAKAHFKDRNWRAVGIFNGNLYVAKGSGGNGDDGIFQVGTGIPKGTNNKIVQLFGAQATAPAPGADPKKAHNGAPSPYTPFGFWFADANTLYVANEGYQNLDANGHLIPDPMAGLQKWMLVNGTWTLIYTLTDGLGLYQPQNIPGYPVTSYTTGIRNMTGIDNGDGSVTIYAITAQYSSISGGGADPNRLVAIADIKKATRKPPMFYTGQGYAETFMTLQTSGLRQVFRGVAVAPRAMFDRSVVSVGSLVP